MKDKVVQELIRTLLPGEIHGELPAVFRAKLQTFQGRGLQVLIHPAIHPVPDDRLGSVHRESCDREAAGHCFQLHNTEGVGMAREHEYRARGDQPGKFFSFFIAGENGIRVLLPELLKGRPVPYNAFFTRQIQFQERFKVLFRRDSADIGENRPGVVQEPLFSRLEQVRVNPSGPKTDLPEPSFVEFLLKYAKILS